ncbi:hypothetical protein GW17_00041002, partial [Ensete ventricosum]
ADRAVTKRTCLQECHDALPSGQRDPLVFFGRVCPCFAMAAVIAFQDWETALGITSGVGCAASAEPHVACIVMSASPAELLYS